MKKLLSIMTVLALVVLMVPSANAADVVLTVSDDTLSASTATDVSITYTTAANFANGDQIKITIKDSTGVLIAASPAAASTPDDQAVTAADGAFGYAAGTATYTFDADVAAGTAVDLSFNFPSVLAGNYTINVAENRVNSVSGEEAYGSVAVYVGNANQVSVSAVVEPILAMNLSGNTVDLGVITPGTITDSSSDTTITVRTNAMSGYIVQAAATTVTGTNSSETVPFTSRSAMVGTTSGFSIDVASVGQGTAGDSTVDAAAGLAGASTYVVDNNAATLAGAHSSIGSSVAGTTDGDTVVVNYAMAVSAVQAADNYGTTVSYTLTGTF